MTVRLMIVGLMTVRIVELVTGRLMTVRLIINGLMTVRILTVSLMKVD